MTAESTVLTFRPLMRVEIIGELLHIARKLVRLGGQIAAQCLRGPVVGTRCPTWLSSETANLEQFRSYAPRFESFIGTGLAKPTALRTAKTDTLLHLYLTQQPACATSQDRTKRANCALLFAQ
jgi:hypothetical protein